MSQHHLLHQCAPLQQLCALPPYTLGRPLHPLNVWLGTRGTVTSLHSDASENLLAQVAGHKYVRLYGLDQTPHLYASLQRGGAFGTSPVRVEAADLAAYPQYASAAYSEAILEPGDLLYIPKSMWHYLRALTTSTSINLWFD
jgi:lysine-specific demethylase 8